jgi:GH25 family lysozyme M1 (1,4-beta-N-acetylmuramidase)
MTLYGIDVSRFQGPVDWVKVKNAGVTFATIKASEGTESQTLAVTRDYFRREFPKARAAGLIVGAYHVVLSGNILEQVAWYLRQLAAVSANPLEIINQIDYEKWDYDFPSYSTLKSLITSLLAATSVRPVLYTGKWIWDQVSGDPTNAADDLNVPLWDSNYGPTNPNIDFKIAYPGDTSTRWRSYGGWNTSILQYGSKTIVPGVSYGCDANAYRGTAEEFRAQFIGGEEVAELNPAQNFPIGSVSWVKTDPEFVDREKVQDGLTLGTMLTETWAAADSLRRRAVEEKARDEAVMAVVQAMAAAVEAGGGSVDTAAVLAGIDERLAAFKAELAAAAKAQADRLGGV